MKFMGREYIELYCRLEPNLWHASVKRGALSAAFVQRMYRQEVIQFTFSPAELTDNLPYPTRIDVRWNDMVDNADEILVFGPRRPTIRNFNELFRRKTRSTYIHHVYRQMVKETLGDARASSSLSMSYQSRMMEVESLKENEQPSKRKRARRRGGGGARHSSTRVDLTGNDLV